MMENDVDLSSMKKRFDKAVYSFKMVIKYSNIVFDKVEYENKDIDELMEYCVEKERYDLCEILKQFYK